LADVVERVTPYFAQNILNDVQAEASRGGAVLVVAHGNSLRALIKHLEGTPDDEIVKLNIPTARPLVYELDDLLKPVRHYYLGDPDEIAAAIAAVAGQGKAAPR
jgi:2,3-bisphosphoglycerate-dependent phosphoglycerate mutase